MLFNIDKCKVMHLGYNNPSVDYFMDAVQLQVVYEEDLGLVHVVTDDLKWEINALQQLSRPVKFSVYINKLMLDSYTTFCLQSVHWHVAMAIKTRCSAIAERPRCRVRYSFRQK